MTKKEMSEIFAVMLLAYPSAEIFKGGAKKLAPTISLWTECCQDIDFWTGRQAVVLLCKECKYPPTIAEFRGKADFITHETKALFDKQLDTFMLTVRAKGVETAYSNLGSGNPLKAAINAVGGPSNLYAESKGIRGKPSKEKRFKYYELEEAYMSAIRQNTELQGTTRVMIQGGVKNDRLSD